MTSLQTNQFQSSQNLPDIPFNEGLYVPDEQDLQNVTENVKDTEKVEFLNG